MPRQHIRVVAAKKYASGMDAMNDDSWESPDIDPYQDHLQRGGGGGVRAGGGSGAAAATSSTLSSTERQQAKTEHGSGASGGLGESSADVPSTTASSSADDENSKQLKRPAITSDWMAGAEWASIGEEFKGVDPGNFLKRVPEGFLTQRAVMDVQPAEELLGDFVAIVDQTYKGVDVRDPSTVTKLESDGQPKWLTMGGKVRAVSEFISGHLAHQVSLPVWQDVFDLKHMEMDLMYWLWVIHLHIVARRSTSVKISTWSRRREVLEELSLTMFASWTHTSEEVMGRPPLSKIRNYIKDMYYVTAINLEEALMHDGPGGDLALLGVLVKFCPLPRPEDIPLYTYYTLVHYIRFHMALFDRISDEEFSKGNFNFFSPDDPAIFKPYSECALDEVIRDWKAAGHESEPGAAAAAAASSADDSAAGEETKEGEVASSSKEDNGNDEDAKKS